MQIKTLLVSALSVVLSSAVVNAATGISVNFYSAPATQDTNTLGSAELGGPANLANWQNFTFPNASDGTNDGVTALGTLTDSTGAVKTGLNMWAGGSGYINSNSLVAPASLSAGQKTYCTNGASGSWGLPGTMTTILQGGMSYEPTIDFQNIPYAQYNVFVMIAPQGGNGVSGQINIVNAGAETGVVDPVVSDGTYNYGWNGNTGSTGWTAGYNMVEFTGNTAPSIEIQKWDNSWGGIAAVQIVNVPEPASMALLALGGLLVLPRRKHA